MVPRELARLRRSIAQVDAAMLALVRQRLALARDVGAQKESAGLAVRDPTVERAVLRRWRDGLRSAGVGRDRSESLGRWLVEESVRAQRRRRSLGRSRDPQRVVIIGGSGAMGRWLARFLRARGHTVTAVRRRAHRPGGRSGRPRPLPPADVVIVSTPIVAAPAIYREIASLADRPLLLDVLSVKEPLRREIAAARRSGFPVASVHPLFGPDADALDGPTLLVLDCGDVRATHRAEALFAPGPLEIVRLPLGDHDPLVARLQALPRLVGLLFALSLGDRGDASPRTPSFSRQWAVAHRGFEEPAHLWSAILSTNPGTAAELARLAASFRKVERALAERGPRALDGLHSTASRSLGGGRRTARRRR